MDTTKHTIVALVENRKGVLNRVVSLFRRRGFNIESLTVGHTDVPEISRMTIVIEGTEAIVEQLVKQLYKLVEVLKLSEVSVDESVVRELALIKVNAPASTRSEIIQIVDIYRANIVDVTRDSLVIEATGPEVKIDSLISLLRGFGIKEVARTGRVIMVRGSLATAKASTYFQETEWKGPEDERPARQKASSKERSTANNEGGRIS
jgi:acetolactate synthase I/III small subunit